MTTLAVYTCRKCGDISTGQVVAAATLASDHQRLTHEVIAWRLDTHCEIVLYPPKLASL